MQRENNRRKLLPKISFHIAGCLNEVACCYLRKKDSKKASESLEVALKIMSQIDEEQRDEPLNAEILCNLAKAEIANAPESFL